MAGLTIEVKCKNIKPYVLGGVQKIEFERFETGDQQYCDYIATTIFDKRRYSLNNVEYIKILGEADTNDSE